MSRRSVPRVDTSFANQFTAFAPKAWTSYKKGADLPTWAREHARVFYHEVAPVPFLQVYHALLGFATTMQTYGQTPAAPRGRQTAGVRAEQTAAESRRCCRAELNKILYSEHSKWWDSFVAEAYDDEDDSATASDRFSWHCAKILSRKTDLSQDDLATVVAAWLVAKF